VNVYAYLEQEVDEGLEDERIVDRIQLDRRLQIPWCYSGVAVVLQCCSSSVTVVLQ
jgi:hypothetical protein